MATEPTEEHAVLGYLTLLWRWKFLVLAIVAVFVAASIFYSASQTKLYTSNATVELISQNITSTGETVALQPSDVTTDIQLVTSAMVRNAVSAKLGHQAPLPSVAEVGTTNILSISYTDHRPWYAARVANLYATSYVQYTIDRFQARSQQQQAILQAKIAADQERITEIENQIHAVSGDTNLLESLNAELQSVSASLSTSQSALLQLQVDAAQASAGAALVTPAKPATTPSSPKPVTDALLAGFIGLLVAIGIALLLDYVDDRIRTKDELVSASGGRPVLAEIPQFENWAPEERDALISSVRPNSQASEAYRSLRTSVQFINFDAESATIFQVTSPTQGDGKTTTAANLAVTMTIGGLRVALVSCDLRRPYIHNFFKVENDLGLSTVLGGTSRIEDAVVEPEAFPGLLLVPSGPIPPNPSELLASTRMQAALETLRTMADVVIIDSPPVLPVTDAVILAQVADSVIVVAHAGHTHSREIVRSIELLESVDAPINGVILNGTTITGGRYRYRYRYGNYGQYYQSGPYSSANKGSQRSILDRLTPKT